MDSEPSQELSPSRRRFLSRLSLGLSALAGALIGLPAVGFIFRGMFRRVPQQWRTLGQLDQFKIGETVQVAFESAHGDRWARESGESGAWLRRTSEDEFTAFSMHCTHLGCPVRWRAKAGMFLCPCHGGTYHGDGSVASGPPLRPLARHLVRVHEGNVEIRTDIIPLPDRELEAG